MVSRAARPLSLKALLTRAGIAAPKGAGAVRGAVAALRHDSRLAGPGDLFCALESFSGREADTLAHIRQAARRGAAAVLAEPGLLKRAALGAGALALPSRDPRGDYARLCAAFYGFPARKLRLSGVTGTNGKTTTSFLLRGILDPEGSRSALIGTVGYWVGRSLRDAPNTTPSALELQGLFAEAVAKGCRFAVMEASSHALDQRRVEGLRFRAAVFTNLTRDHLDYHGTFAAYGRAKARLFALLEPGGVAVVNAEDPASRLMAAARAKGARLLSYHAGGGRAELRAEDVRLGLDGTRFTLRYGGRGVDLLMPLPGRFNVANALAAAGAALGQGLSLARVAEGLARPSLPPGRFERVSAGQPFLVAVDYAHTPDALERLIRAARECVPGRVITVFGCGGDRDRGKRPQMGRLSAELSDLSVVTSDNPRTEKPAAILDEILAGVPPRLAPKALRVPDRRAAIARAMKAAKAGDAVLLAGKGHEPYQIVGAVRHPFDDRAEARRALAKLGYRAKRGGR